MTFIAYDVVNDSEDHKKRLNYKRGDYEELTKYFKNIRLEKELSGNMGNQHEKFCENQKIRTLRYIPHNKENQKK